MAEMSLSGVDIEYETFGDHLKPAVLLVMGLGGSHVVWPDKLCHGLAEAGFHVVKFDNRDVGRSSKLDHLGTPDLMALMGAVMKGERPSAPYSLSDMARDAVLLLDGLEIERAHIVGASMGGMIAQLIAIEHGDIAMSLTSIMSHNGEQGKYQGRPEATATLMTPLPDNRRETLIAAQMKTWRTIGSPGYPAGEAELRTLAERVVDQGTSATGFARQLAAILAAPSRAEALGALRLPTMILHGADDPLVPVQAAYDMAEIMPRARLRVIPGMGHDFTEALAEVYLRELTDFFKAA